MSSVVNKVLIFHGYHNRGIDAKQILINGHDNLGNYMFLDAMFRGYKHAEKLNFKEIQALPDSANDTSDNLLVLDLANMFSPHSDYGHIADILEKTQISVALIGVGVQAQHGDAIDFDISKGTRRLLDIVTERSSAIGTRGYYTAEFLNSHGYKRVQPIGCPAFFSYMDANFELQRAASLPTNPAIATATTLTGQQVEFIRALLFWSVRYAKGYLVQNEIQYLISDNLEQQNNIIRQSANPDFIKKVIEQRNNNIQFYSKPELPRSNLLNWFKNAALVSNSTVEWLQWAKQFDFYLGSRLYGGCAMNLVGTPTLFIDIDIRTRELLEFYSLPKINAQDFDSSKTPEYYFDKIDYSAYNYNYKKLYNNYVDFLLSNGIEPNETSAVQQSWLPDATEQNVESHVVTDCGIDSVRGEVVSLTSIKNQKLNTLKSSLEEVSSINSNLAKEKEKLKEALNKKDNELQLLRRQLQEKTAAFEQNNQKHLEQEESGVGLEKYFSRIWLDNSGGSVAESLAADADITCKSFRNPARCKITHVGCDIKADYQCNLFQLNSTLQEINSLNIYDCLEYFTFDGVHHILERVHKTMRIGSELNIEVPSFKVHSDSFLRFDWQANKQQIEPDEVGKLPFYDHKLTIRSVYSLSSLQYLVEAAGFKIVEINEEEKIGVRAVKVMDDGERLISSKLLGTNIYIDHTSRYLFARNLISKEDASILDGACGIGYGSTLLASHNKVTSCDISADAIRYAKQFYARDNIEFRCMDLCGETEFHNRFDYVVSYETIEHVPDAYKLVHNFYSYLKSGGEIIASVPNEETVPFKSDVTSTTHFRHYTLEEFSALLTNQGFEIIDTYYQCWSPSQNKGETRRYGKYVFSKVNQGPNIVIHARKP